MAMKYYKLFDLLNRRNITKTKMRIDLGMSTKTLAKISAHESLSMEIIEKICAYLDVQPGDLMEYVDDKLDKNFDSQI
jgi:DNA-binding Xre family transcriptional regulator